jgi:ketosteroid isomerase-like protein
MTQDQEEVAQANLEFYRAFESLDINEMEKVWLKESYVRCIHPGSALLTGWDNVITSWRNIFQNTKEMHFRLTEVTVHVRGPLAWLTLYENITSRIGEDNAEGVILTTNVFENRDGKWWIIHHHGGPTMTATTESETTLH